MSQQFGRSTDPEKTGVRRWETRAGSKTELRTIGCDGCWCGKPNGHDWPGKADGAPHPR